MGFSRQEYRSELPLPLQAIYPTQGSNPGLPHCRQILHHLSHQGSPPRVMLGMCGGKHRLDAGLLREDMQALVWQDSLRREGNKAHTVPFGGVIFSLLPWLLEREGAVMMLLGCFWNTECAHGCFLGPEKQQRPGLLGKDMGVEHCHGQDGVCLPTCCLLFSC